MFTASASPACRRCLEQHYPVPLLQQQSKPVNASLAAARPADSLISAVGWR
jgi:hypothetical protein